MNKKLKLISCLITGIMSSGAYADTTENNDNYHVSQGCSTFF